MENLPGHEPGKWHGPNSHMLDWPSLAWAWEFLRRNPPLWQKWTEAQPDIEIIESTDRLRVIHLNDRGLLPYPCLFASSAAEDARVATVVWDPRSFPYALRAIAVPLRNALGAVRFELSALPHPAALVLTSDGTQHLVIRDGPRSLQLTVSGTSLLEPVALLVDTTVEPELAGEQAAVLRCLRDWRATGRMLDKYFPPAPRARSYAMKLKALDLSLAGATQRKIAVALFGEDAASQWRTDENLRYRVRYSIACGRALMERGYRMFLAAPQLSRRSR